MPIPATVDPFTIRPARTDDIGFCDQLQKLEAHKLGFQYFGAYEKAIANGNQLFIAEDERRCPMGFCLGKDRYSGRDEVGIIFQLAVVPIKQRRKLGANLLKTFIEHAAYGMKLLCCYCAQDLQANHFWESLGFVPIAFRTGSRRMQRIHIFWQRRVRTGDIQTAFWYPSCTHAGAVQEDRLVLPIPPGTHWRDAKPVVLPDQTGTRALATLANGLPDLRYLPGKVLAARPATTLEQYRANMMAKAAKSRHLKGFIPGCMRVEVAGKLHHVPITQQAMSEAVRPVKAKKPRCKVDPVHAAQSRELRDRMLEAVNATGYSEVGKYDPSRALENMSCKAERFALPSS